MQLKQKIPRPSGDLILCYIQSRHAHRLLYAHHSTVASAHLATERSICIKYIEASQNMVNGMLKYIPAPLALQNQYCITNHCLQF